MTGPSRMLGHVPSRLGTVLAMDGDQVVDRLTPTPALGPRGTISMASVVLLVDAVCGYNLSVEPASGESWAFTSDISVRLPVQAPPEAIDTSLSVLHAGRRSITFETALTVAGEHWATAFARFARVPKPADVDRPSPDARRVLGRPVPPIEVPLREAAGFESRDPARGVVATDLRRDLLNMAGSLQGAIVAGLAETAAEDLADHHLGSAGDHVVTEMEVRYLSPNLRPPIVTLAWFVGSPAEGQVRVDLVEEDGAGRRTTAVLARVQPAPR